MNTFISYTAKILSIAILSLVLIESSDAQFVTANPLVQNFSQVNVGVATPSQCFVISNSSNTNYGINSITLSGTNPGDFQITSFIPTGSQNAVIVPANGSVQVCVLFKPTATGLRNAKLNLKLTDPFYTGPLVLDLNGGAAAPILTNPRIVAKPNPIEFDSVALGDSVCKTITISNPGTDTLIIKNQVITSSEGDFHISILAPELTRIPPNQSRFINVCFKPRQAGSREARLTLYTNIPVTAIGDTGALNINFGGTGVPHGVLLITTSNGIDSAIIGKTICRADTIWNTGEGDLLVNSLTITGTNASEFNFTSARLPFTIKSNSKAIITVCGTPSVRGLRQATLNVVAKSNERTLTAGIPLNVFGQLVCSSTNPIVLFADQKIVKHSDSILCVTVTNCGDVISNYSARIPDTTYYSLSSSTINGVMPGKTATFCVKFNPRISGILPSKLIVSSNNTADMSVDLIGIGACAQLASDTIVIPQVNAGGHGTFKVTVKNTGNLNWNPGTPVFSPNDGIYSFSGTVPTILAGDSTQLQFHYDPAITNHQYATQVTFPNGGPCSEAPLVLSFSKQTGTEGVSRKTEQDGFTLDQNYPNPASGLTNFNFTIPNDATVKVSMFDMKGHEVLKLISGRISVGLHLVSFDASHLASGTYIYVLESNGIRLSRYIILSK